MNTQRKLMILATVLAFLTTLPAARASDQDQASKLTLTRPSRFQGAFCPREPIGSYYQWPTRHLTSSKFSTQTDPCSMRLFRRSALSVRTPQTTLR